MNAGLTHPTTKVALLSRQKDGGQARGELVGKLIRESLKKIETIASDSFMVYLEKFRPTFLDKLCSSKKMEQNWNDFHDIDKLKIVLDNWVRKWQETKARLSWKIKRKEKAKIHILKDKLGISDDDYRLILLESTGLDSCRDIVYFEFMVAERAMYDFKEKHLNI